MHRVWMRRRRLSPWGESGVSLVEMLVALTLTTMVMTGVAYGIIKALRTTGDSKNREVATNLASAAIDQARATTDYSTLLGSTWTENVNGLNFTVLRTVTSYSSSGSASPCDGSASSYIKYKRVSIRVTWPTKLSTTPSVRSDTLLAPGVSSFDPTKGNVGAKVLNALGQPVEGILVQLVGGSVALGQYTDENGCAFFDGLDAGAYTATANTPGYVSSNGLDAPSLPASVSSGTTTPVAFDYDLDGSFRVKLGSSSYPAPNAVPVTIGNSALLPGGSQTVNGVGDDRILTNRFPFPSGYTAWAGSCTDADPEGDSGSGPYHPTGARGTAVLASASVPTKVLDMAEIRVAVVRDATGIPVPGAVVRLTHAGSAICGSVEDFFLDPTDGSGETTASMPWGEWAVTVGGLIQVASVQPVFHPTGSEIYVEVRVL